MEKLLEENGWTLTPEGKYLHISDFGVIQFTFDQASAILKDQIAKESR